MKSAICAQVDDSDKWVGDAAGELKNKMCTYSWDCSVDNKRVQGANGKVIGCTCPEGAGTLSDNSKERRFCGDRFAPEATKLSFPTATCQAHSAIQADADGKDQYGRLMKPNKKAGETCGDNDLCPFTCGCPGGEGQKVTGQYCRGPNGEEDRTRCGKGTHKGNVCDSNWDCGGEEAGVTYNDIRLGLSCGCSHMPTRFPETISSMANVTEPIAFMTCNVNNTLVSGVVSLSLERKSIVQY